MNEDLKALLEKFEISEDTVTQLEEMVAASINSALQAQKESHEEEIAQLKESANDYGEYIKESLIQKLDGYAAYVSDQFIAENKDRLVATEQFMRMEECFNAVKDAFELNGFSINESVREDTMAAELTEAKSSYDALFTQLTEANNKIEEMTRAAVFASLTKDLAATQVERVTELAEAVTFDSVSEYTRGIEMIVEQISTINEEVEVPEILEESVQVKSVASPKIQSYVQALKRLGK